MQPSAEFIEQIRQRQFEAQQRLNRAKQNRLNEQREDQLRRMREWQQNLEAQLKRQTESASVQLEKSNSKPEKIKRPEITKKSDYVAPLPTLSNVNQIKTNQATLPQSQLSQGQSVDISSNTQRQHQTKHVSSRRRIRVQVSGKRADTVSGVKGRARLQAPSFSSSSSFSDNQTETGTTVTSVATNITTTKAPTTLANSVFEKEEATSTNATKDDATVQTTTAQVVITTSSPVQANQSISEESSEEVDDSLAVVLKEFASTATTNPSLISTTTESLTTKSPTTGESNVSSQTITTTETSLTTDVVNGSLLTTTTALPTTADTNANATTGEATDASFAPLRVTTVASTSPSTVQASEQLIGGAVKQQTKGQLKGRQSAEKSKTGKTSSRWTLYGESPASKGRFQNDLQRKL